MTDTLTVTGLELWGYHGVFDEEKATGQRFVIDLEIQVDISRAAHSDRVEDTLNYAELIDRVASVVTGPPLELIETLATHILEVIWTFPEATAAGVTVHKPDAPVGYTVGDIALTLNRHRPR